VVAAIFEQQLGMRHQAQIARLRSGKFELLQIIVAALEMLLLVRRACRDDQT